MTIYSRKLRMSDEDREAIENSPALHMSMEELSLVALADLLDRHKAPSDSLPPDPSTPAPSIPESFQKAYDQI